MQHIMANKKGNHPNVKFPLKHDSEVIQVHNVDRHDENDHSNNNEVNPKILSSNLVLSQEKKIQ